MIILFWELILALSTVNCGLVSENFIVDVQDIDVPKSYNTPFQVYWNVPTKQCRSKNISFDDLLRKFKISYNKKDKFEGETITIIYNVGLIPAILRREGEKFYVRNGGLPQEGNLELHLAAFREHVNRLIPDPDFSGVGVLDMEEWRPIFRQHWSIRESIIDLSLSIEKRQYWWWPTAWQKMEATKRFEDAARIFMEKTLITAKQMRPKAVWGYYGFPYCFNMYGKNMAEHCSENVKGENDRIYWLWAESTALYPSIYSNSYFSTSELKKLVKGRLTESNRVKKAGDLVLPYFAITYRDGGFFKEKDTITVFETLQKKNASGLVIWGASSDVDTVEKCKQLYKYVDSYFGPIAKKYIQRINMIQKVSETKEDTVNRSSTVIATTRTPIYNSIEDNTISSIIRTTEKSNDESHINELNQLNKYLYKTQDSKIYSHSSKSVPENNSGHDLNNTTNILLNLIENTNNNTKNNVNSLKQPTIHLSNLDTKMTVEQLNKYYYENNESRAELQNSSESVIWNIITYENSVENEKITEYPFTEYSSTTTHKISINKTKALFTIDNSTYSSIETKSDTKIDILDDVIKSSLEINPLNTSVVNNVTESDPEFIQLVEQKEQLTNYYYETDENKEKFKNSNLSEIWSLIKYGTSSENENINDSIRTKQYTENPEPFIYKDIEFTWVPTKNNSTDVHNFGKEMYLTNNTFYKTENNIDTKNNTADTLETAAFNLTSTLISPVNSINMAIVKPENSKTKANKENYFYDYLITLENDRTYPYKSEDDTGIKVHLDSDLDYASSLEFTYLPPNSNSKDFLQTVKQEDQHEKAITYPNDKASREKVVLDYLITPAVQLTNPMKTSINDSYTRINLGKTSSLDLNLVSSDNYWNNISQNEQQQQRVENNIYNNIEAMSSTAIDVSEFVVASLLNLTNPANTSITGKNIQKKQDESLGNLVYNLLPSNNYSKIMSQHLKRKEQISNDYDSDYLITLASDFNTSIKGELISNDIEIDLAKVIGKQDVSDYLITLAVDYNNSMYKSINDNDTETEYENEDQLTTNTTRIKTSNIGVENIPDNLIDFSEDLTSFMRTQKNISQQKQFLTDSSSIVKNNTNTYIEATSSKEINASKYSVASELDLTHAVNTSMKGNKTEIKLENVESATIAELHLPPSNNYSNNISKNGIQEQHTKNSTNPNNGENDILDYSITQVDLLNPMPGNDTEIDLNSVESASSLEFNLLPSKYYSKNFSQNVNLDEQVLRQTSYSNSETNRKNEISDNITLTVDFINPVNASLNGNYA